MCFFVKKVKRSGTRKADSFGGKKGEEYFTETWEKCGTCAECRAEKANNWVVRASYEARAHGENACFITLTYAVSPIVLVRKHLQDWLKRFRKAVGVPIRYFGCGEYGQSPEGTHRPHYHLIIWGWNDPAKKLKGFSLRGNPLYESELITRTWGHGRTSYQNYNPAEAGYMALYQSVNEGLIIDRRLAKQAYLDLVGKKNLQALETAKTRCEREKSEYLSIREFNCWSEGIGYMEWAKTLRNKGEGLWVEYVLDGEYLTPSPWVRQCALQGVTIARDEMIRRSEYEENRAETAQQRRAQKAQKAQEREKRLILDAKKARLFDWL